MKKPRIGIYEPWNSNIDAGWTRWILEQFHFPFTVLHNPDVLGGHLRDRFDTQRMAHYWGDCIAGGGAGGKGKVEERGGFWLKRRNGL